MTNVREWPHANGNGDVAFNDLQLNDYVPGRGVVKEIARSTSGDVILLRFSTDWGQDDAVEIHHTNGHFVGVRRTHFVIAEEPW